MKPVDGAFIQTVDGMGIRKMLGAEKNVWSGISWANR